MTVKVMLRKISRLQPTLLYWLDYIQNKSIKTKFGGRRYKLDSHTLLVRCKLVFLMETWWGWGEVYIQSLIYMHIKKFKAGFKTMSRVTPPKIYMNIGKII